MHVLRRLGRFAPFAAMLLVAAFAVVVAPEVFAQTADTLGLSEVGGTVKLPDTDPRIIASRIINASLGFIGIILVGIFLYAGFLYMTSGGEPEQTTRAKKLMTNGVIGLVIVLSSWGISSFVIRSLLDATGGDGSGSGSGSGTGGGGFGGGSGAQGFQVQSISPSGQITIRNAVVKVTFTRDIDPGIFSATVKKVSDTSDAAGAWSITGKVATFTPSTPCPDPNATKFCLEENTEYRVTIAGTTKSSTGQTLTCGGIAPACTGTFTTGNVVDVAPPTISLSSPTNGSIFNVTDPLSINFSAEDDSGISIIEFFADDQLLSQEPFTGVPVRTSINGNLTRPDMWGLAPGTHVIKATAYDLDSNQTDSSQISITIRPAYCVNGVKDGDETAIDCGGSCGVCSGSACTTNSECASGACVNNICVEAPVITDFSPKDGRTGTIVTITGRGFGTTPGKVRFSNGVEAAPAAVCLNAGVSVWSSYSLLVQVPDGAATGPIEVEHATNGLKDTSNDTNGTVLDSFTVNDVAHPAICQVSPTGAYRGDQVQIIGAGFGDTSGKVFFDDRELSTVQSWTDTNVVFNAPVFTPKFYQVSINSNNVLSNNRSFELKERAPTAKPVINSITPDSGPIGQYITLQGTDFGSTVGKVVFKRADGATGLADTNFPEACGTGFWTNTAVTVKIPATVSAGLGPEALANGSYSVTLERSDAQVSDPKTVSVISGQPTPGLCAILPAAGPIGTQVQFVGENFGNLGSVTFSSGGNSRVNASVQSQTWASQSVITTVPVGALTGKAQLSTNGQFSNEVPFAVQSCKTTPDICGVGEQCCDTGACSVNGICPVTKKSSEFAWRVSTGQIPSYPYVVEECHEWAPSPTPWSGSGSSKDACTNAMLGIRFSTHMDYNTLNSTNIELRRCIGTGSDPCESLGEPHQFMDGMPWVYWFDGEQDYVQFAPSFRVFPEFTSYVVKLKTDIKSVTGDSLAERPECGAGYGYCFTFKTRAANDQCKLGIIKVLPEQHTMSNLNETVDYGLTAVPAGEQCLVMNLYALENLTVNWSTSDGRASITTNPNPYYTSTQDFGQVATGLADTGNDPVGVKLDITIDGDLYTDTAELFIDTQPPKVLNVGPNCDVACSNAAIWAEFSSPMLESSITDVFELRRCTNENCQSFDRVWTSDELPPAVLTTVPGTQSTDQRFAKLDAVDSQGNTLLEKGRFYQVTIKGGTIDGARSIDGLLLSELNDPRGYVYNFRVKNEEDPTCGVSQVTVSPVKKVETMTGARQSFVAMSKASPDACSKTGQILSDTQSYAWTINQTGTISRYINGGTGSLLGLGTVDTSVNRPLGCTDRCIEKGAGAVVGKVASCGNRVIETVNAQYCRNSAGNGPCAVNGTGCRTIFGDACTVLGAGASGSEECDEGSETASCSTQCLWKPLTGAQCGNGTLDRGEQCDPGPSGAPGCTLDCQVLGAAAGGSTCGNGDIAAGESCDDNNTTSGDGCSSQCINEGSSRVVAICGNGTLEAGETCEKTGATWPVASCDVNTCLAKGTSACSGSGATNCCGNVSVEAGETCDDGNAVNGDGCSAACLKEGSSMSYLVPSFCGDGVVGAGESAQCETSGGDGKQDSLQVAEIVGDGTPDVAGFMSSQLNATLSQKVGVAEYGLQCGKTSELSCPVGTGLDSNGCCAPRPAYLIGYPYSNLTNVCRNTGMYIQFNTSMDEASVRDNLFITEEVNAAACPAGSTQVNFFAKAESKSVIVRVWNWFKGLFGQNATAAIYCAGSVSADLTFNEINGRTKVDIKIKDALKANTTYRLWVRGDQNLIDNPANKVGVRSKRGVVASGQIITPFTTGNDICQISALRVSDTNVTSPALFTKSTETHRYQVEPVSLQGGTAAPIVPVSQYNWTYAPWTTSDANVLSVAAVTGDSSVSDVTSKEKAGTAYISAELKVTADTVQNPPTVNKIIRGSLLSTVMLCQAPWPARELGPFADVKNSAALEAYAPELASGETFFNFSTMYCRDGGDQSVDTDNLPAMQAVAVDRSNTDIAQGVLRQFLLSFDEGLYPELAGDGIGIRVMTNPLHLSVKDWYTSKGFKGNPQTVIIDGYEAIKDGATTYISAANTNALADAKVYPNIYLISRNPNANKQTEEIYNQLVSNFVLNANLQDDVQNTCVYAVQDGTHASNETYLGADGKTVSCTADWECLQKNPNLRCASFKAKLSRDLKRIADFSRMTTQLEKTKAGAGRYPELTSGSFIQGMTNSRWPSWNTVFGGTQLAVDPVNRFLTCGVCSQSQSACNFDTDCSQGESCIAPAGKEGLEASTCWNTISKRYMCPQLNPSTQSSVSRIYQYRAVNGGDRFELGTELEAADASRYVPSLLTEAKKCSNFESPCKVDADCTITDFQTSAVLSTGQCLPTGGNWKYAGICTGTEYGQDDVCGNGVIGPNEICELGDTRGASCALTGGAPGTKLQICNDCKAFVDSKNSTCVAQSLCGNGRLDTNQCLGGEGKKYGQSCTTAGSASECLSAGDPAGTQITCTALPVAEICDDGSAVNGTYGKCNRTCTGYDNFCGDGKLSAGESCDNGSANGQYCGLGCSIAATCNSSCSGVTARCGDGKVDASNEQCDGNAETSEEGCSPQPWCTVKDANSNLIPCGTLCTDAGGTCGTYNTQKVRTCAASGTVNQCQFESWSACRVIGSCGDGNVDQGEECDDGNTLSTDSCTNSCKKNICGDGVRNAAVEECDYGAQNGGSCPVGAEYGSNCLACSTSCKQVAQSGGYCGNGKVDGPEQCDGGLLAQTDISCKQLGYDYAESVVSGKDAISCTAGCEYTGCKKCSEAGGNGTISGQVFDSLNRYYPIPGARVTLYSKGIRMAEQIADADGKFTFTNLQTRSECSGYKIVIDYYKDNLCTGNKTGRPKCNSVAWTDVKYMDGGTWVTNQPDWYSSWTGMKEVSLPAPDEGANGGYWAYDQTITEVSAVTDLGKIYLSPKTIQSDVLSVIDAPKLQEFRALVPEPTDKSYSRYFDNFLVLPPEMAHEDAWDGGYNLGYMPYKFEPSNPCTWGSSANCSRRFWRGDMNLDLSKWPHAYLACYTPWLYGDVNTLPSYASPKNGSNISLHCSEPFGIKDSFPRVDAYRRGSWNKVDGSNYNLITLNPGLSKTIGNGIDLRVRVYTAENAYTINYKDATINDCPGSNGVYYWHVYSQDAKTGIVSIVNQIVSGSCSVPGEPNEIYWTLIDR